MGGGHSWTPPAEPIKLPSKLPQSYPTILAARTDETLNVARKEFPNNSDIVVFCQAVLSVLTAALYAEVGEGRLGADLARSSMKELLELLVRVNCKDSEWPSREQEILRSEEWHSFTSGLARLEVELALERAARVRAREDELRSILRKTREKMVESSPIWNRGPDSVTLRALGIPPQEEKHEATEAQASVNDLAGQGKRKSYRTEVQQWMQQKNLETLEQASRRLGISHSTLKSIMSDKGKPRFGQATLERVLREICSKP